MSETKPVLFFEADQTICAESLESIRKALANKLGDRFDCVVLSKGLRLVNEQEFLPQSLAVSVGSIEIAAESTSSGSRGSVVIDGVKMKGVRAATVKVGVDHAPIVQLELTPQSGRAHVEFRDDEST